MPILSMFYGIIIRMYFRDDKQHRTPHIHAAWSLAVHGEGIFKIDPLR
jgi:hypothetical protein